MSSSRLPGKILLPLAGAPALQRQIERVRRASCLDHVVVATSVNEEDDAVAELCEAVGCACHRGSEIDVLDRVLQAARSAQADWIVELSGDCPLLDGHLVDEAVRTLRAKAYSYLYNRMDAALPDGFDVEVFAMESLEKISVETADPVDRVHVSSFFRRHPDRFPQGGVPRSDGDPLYWPDLAVTLDEEADYQLIAAVFEELHPRNPDFTAVDVLDLLRERPDLVALNRHVRRKTLEEG